ncbi:hypothetical protein [Paenibacillus campinasensis]|uniref:Uncharacterized protein n=1 Tax=Paenibacillus campinasensis TaxID=66347 RepID=A0A268EH83_9BACL|nr:hypothetical protein [Paenibacillus campinasensis]PAD72439.1 hypothetical protein CHH67_22625 [Paenibacillus campinasensis]
MADTIRELNVGLTIDQTDIAATIRGLKAIQREAKKATQALRELEAVQIKQNGVVEYGGNNDVSDARRVLR